MNGLGITQLTQKGEQVLCACPPGLFLGKMPHLHKGHRKAKLMYGTRVTRLPLLAGEKGEVFGELLMRGGQRWAASYPSLALKLPPTAWGQQDADQWPRPGSVHLPLCHAGAAAGRSTGSAPQRSCQLCLSPPHICSWPQTRFIFFSLAANMVALGKDVGRAHLDQMTICICFRELFVLARL